MKLKYGTKAINAFTKKLETIDKQINDIQVKLDELNQEVDKESDNFDLSAIESKKGLLSERSLYADSLKKAKAHRQKIIDENNDKLVDDLTKELDEVIDKAQADNQKVRDKQKKKLREFVELTQQVEKENKELKTELLRAVNAIRPFVDDDMEKAVAPYGRLRTKIEPTYKNFLKNTLDPATIGQLESVAK